MMVNTAVNIFIYLGSEEALAHLPRVEQRQMDLTGALVVVVGGKVGGVTGRNRTERKA